MTRLGLATVTALAATITLICGCGAQGTSHPSGGAGLTTTAGISSSTTRTGLALAFTVTDLTPDQRTRVSESGKPGVPYPGLVLSSAGQPLLVGVELPACGERASVTSVMMVDSTVKVVYEFPAPPPQPAPTGNAGNGCGDYAFGEGLLVDTESTPSNSPMVVVSGPLRPQAAG